MRKKVFNYRLTTHSLPFVKTNFQCDLVFIDPCIVIHVYGVYMVYGAAIAAAGNQKRL
jgi:hypothetical protein